MLCITDQIGYPLILSQTPARVVSLVPSQTELLYDLGLGDKVVGITKFCVHPEIWFREKPRIGGTKKINFHKVAELKPDLILANKEENVKEQVDALRQLAPVWTSDISTLEDAYQMISCLASITGTEAKALQIIQKISTGFDAFLLNREKMYQPSKKVAYLIWQDPLMTVGGDTFIHEILCRSNLQNVFADQIRYPQITATDLQEKQPDFLFLSSEPYPFGEKQVQVFQQLLPGTRVQLVDGQMFSWYGSRLQYVPAYLAGLVAG